MSAPTSAAGQAVARLTHRLPGIDLETVLACAELQQRIDTKFVVFPAVLDRLTGFGTEFSALDIGGRRRFGYSSRYLDTAQLTTLRDHVQGRRHRYKVRVRTYTDAENSGQRYLELKLAGFRGCTEKLRWPLLPSADGDPVPEPAVEALKAVLVERGLDVPQELTPSLTIDYTRATLVGLDRPVRVTVDTDLAWRGAGRRVEALHDRVLLEVKSPHARDPIVRRLAEVGIRPARISKYGIGMGLTRPGLPVQPWAEAIRDHVGSSATNSAATTSAAEGVERKSARRAA